jgi:Uma2 family endonuclease
VEILSPGDRFADTVAKCEEYHAWGVRYCWIVDPDHRQSWEYHAQTRPKPIGEAGKIEAGLIVLSIAELFEVL